jgi:hypothetical protein
MAGNRATIVIVAGRLVLGAWTRRLHRTLRLFHRIHCCQMQVILAGRHCHVPGRCDCGPRRQRLCGLPVIGGMTSVRRRRAGEEEASHHGERQSSQQPRNGIGPRHDRRIEPRSLSCQSPDTLTCPSDPFKQKLVHQMLSCLSIAYLVPSATLSPGHRSPESPAR